MSHVFRAQTPVCLRRKSVAFLALLHGISPRCNAVPTPCCKMQADARWWRSFEHTLARLRKLNLGCSHCRTGTCLTLFASPEAQSELRAWHGQWSGLPAAAQDAHILWAFRGSMGCQTSSEGAQGAVTSESNTEDLGRASPAEVHTESDSGDDQACPSKRQRIDTESETSEVSLDSESGEPSGTAVPRLRQRRPRRGRFSVEVLGRKVCVAAGLQLMRVGAPRLSRVLAGHADGRKSRVHVPGKQIASVWTFLWRVYHSVAESMPDKFDFGSEEAQTMVLAVTGRARRQGSLPISAVHDEDASDDNGGQESGEHVTRAIAAHAMHLESCRNPAENTALGPGMFDGPLRFLPPGKRIYLYWEYAAWSRQWNMPVASFRTFLRAFGKCQHRLRFRKVGQHAVCQTCTTLKARLRAARRLEELGV